MTSDPVLQKQKTMLLIGGIAVGGIVTAGLMAQFTPPREWAEHSGGSFAGASTPVAPTSVTYDPPAVTVKSKFQASITPKYSARRIAHKSLEIVSKCAKGSGSRRLSSTRSGTLDNRLRRRRSL